MRIFQSEFGHDYGTYSFGYTTRAEYESGDSFEQFYDAGFLPYSAKTDVHNLFYMARSLRVDVKHFTPSSENRRVFRKFDGQYSSTVVARDELKKDSLFRDLFLSYFQNRHGENVMSSERLGGILDTELPLRGIRYEHEGTPVAYVLEPAEGSWAHYWFSCYSETHFDTSFGMWLMQDAVRRAQAEGRTHFYVGTAYGAKATYKTNLPSLEFWDGSAWNKDGKALQRLLGEDAGREVSFPDRFTDS